ncbi:SSL2 DNA or RNA helicases of superfamily II [uncultured Caudovirales phage]|uniref:SSL2 DNA or RNA helicases of superfamily II n=1 Tax=uncultured Caudovirales phage TaxID=2100421 RepID=A0A6J5NUK6_9CAUD|nr:SSL2 DNA or RNA helicases of superfamily II [uncultured Caudovirales phage]
MKLLADSMLWMPERIGEEFASLCVVRPRSFDGEPVEEIDPVVRREGLVGLPLTIGAVWAERAGHTLVDSTTQGGEMNARRLPSADHPNAPPGQAEFFDKVLYATRTQLAVCAQAQTGAGKTVCGCFVAGTLGRATLAIVPSVTLAHQWIGEVRKHLGLKASEVGIVQSGEFPKGKQFVAAVIHNLIDGTLRDEWARQFGTVIWDEAHRLGAREFSRSLALFPAAYKLALTATPNRKDGCWRLVEDYFGPVSALAEGDEMETHCYQIFSDFPPPPHLLNANQLSPLLPFLAQSYGRNTLAVNTVMDLYRKGRRIVVMADSVRHLQILHNMLVAQGVPKAEFGFYTGFTIPDADLKKRGKKVRKRLVSTQAHQLIRESKTIRIVLGTYAQMREGVNIPWLDAGLDLTPRSDAIQVVGRIRRRLPGKPIPCWFTLVDRRIPLLFAFAKARLKGLVSAGITVHDD